MKFVSKSLLFLIALAAMPAYAQNMANTPIKHVIVVIQENRTPDNLFQDQNLVNAGADIVAPQTGGPCCTWNALGTCTEHQVALYPLALKNCTDPRHGHGNWVSQYRSGAMDGACNHPTSGGGSNNQIQYPCPFDHLLDCSQYTYVCTISVWEMTSRILVDLS